MGQARPGHGHTARATRARAPSRGTADAVGNPPRKPDLLAEPCDRDSARHKDALFLLGTAWVKIPCSVLITATPNIPLTSEEGLFTALSSWTRTDGTAQDSPCPQRQPPGDNPAPPP